MHAALQRYLTYKQAPKLVHQHKVEPVGTASLGQRILDSIKSLRGRWFGTE